MPNCINSFYGRGDSVTRAMDIATGKANEWLISLSLDWNGVHVASMSTQCFPSEVDYDVYIITLAVKCEGSKK